MLGPERETVRTLGRHPGLFAGGLLAAAAWITASFVAAVPVLVVVLPRNTQPVFVLPLASVVSVLALPPALGGLYATAREARGGESRFGVGGSLAPVVRGCARNARELTVATVTFRAVALLPAAAVFALLLAGDTALDHWRYANGDVGAVSGPQELVFVWLFAMVAGAAGRLLLAFYDLPVLFGDVAPRRGWRAGLRFARRRPRSLLRYGTGRVLLWSPTLLLLGPWVELLLGEWPAGDPPSSVILFVVAAAVVGTVTATMLAVHHVVVYERTVAPALAATAVESDAADGVESATGVGPAAAALAVLVVTAAGAGAVGVRVSDARPMPDADVGQIDGGTSADAVVRDATRTVATSSHRSVTRNYRVDGATGDRRLVTEYRFAIDRRDRRARFAAKLREGDADEWQRVAYYASEGTMAMNLPGDGPAGRVPLRERFVGRSAGDWGVVYAPGYVLLDGQASGTLPGDAQGADWQVRERTGDRVVVGYTDRADDAPPDDGTAVPVERVRLTVDRDTGRPTARVTNRTYVAYEDGTEVERYRLLEEVQYRDFDDTAAERPDAIGPRGPVEWLWDLVYY